ncbi:MAG: pseudouridine synthase [Syntrophobacteraceae bacterium]
MEGIRLQKVLASAGVASRRAAEEIIRQGRVQINGRAVTELGVRVDPEIDEVRVDGSLLSRSKTEIYLLFYKPKHCVTTLKDPQGRKTVLDFIPDLGVRVFPVGRLDYDAEGLLLLTNDGFLANRLQHPRYGVSKTYEVKVKGHPDDRALSRLRTGVSLDEGRTAPAEIEVLSFLPKAAWLKIILHQGWYRQIKRMCLAVGYPVLKIKRVGYAFLKLGDLKPGTFRPLERHEAQKLYKTVQQEVERI